MAELHLNNDHNKVAYLLKPTESLEVSLPDGVKGLVATIDGTTYTVTEASIRSALQLDDLNAIDTMTNEEIFAGLRDIGQSSPPPIPFGPAPTSGVVSTNPILDITSSSRPSKPVLETITSPFRDDDTGGGFFHESPPPPHPATLTFGPTNLESKLKTKKRKLVLSDSENEEEERQSKELDALLVLANAALHEPSLSTTPSKPANPEQSSKQEISPTTLDAILTLSQSKARARATTIIYKRLKKKKSSFGLDFTDADIPAGGLDSAGGLDFASGLVFAGGIDSAGGLNSAGGLVSAGGIDSVGGLTSAGKAWHLRHSQYTDKPNWTGLLSTLLKRSGLA
nr:hypothetical protein [Tanacetum cinerariifolium]